MAPVLVATRRFCQSYKFSATRGDAPPPGNCVDFVIFPSPMPPLSYSLAVTWVMFDDAEPLVGVHLEPFVVESSVPIQVEASR